LEKLWGGTSEPSVSRLHARGWFGWCGTLCLHRQLSGCVHEYLSSQRAGVRLDLCDFGLCHDRLDSAEPHSSEKIQEPADYPFLDALSGVYRDSADYRHLRPVAECLYLGRSDVSLPDGSRAKQPEYGCAFTGAF